MNEEWRDVEGYGGLYQVSNLGRVRSKRGILKPRITPKGYLRIQLSKGGNRKDKFVHVLVAETFLCKYDSTLQVNHIDGDKTNNKVSNLEWCTCSENIKHAFKTGLKKPTKYFKGKHTYHNMKKVECIETGKKFNSIREAAQYYNCDENKIGMVCRGQRKSCGKYKNIKLTWRYIYE